MSYANKSEVQFGESGEASLASYRSINWTSVVGLILGLLSMFALVHWLLLWIAVAAILVSLVALRQIAARPDELLGRKAALAGIGLALFGTGFAITREVTLRRTAERQAREHARAWFELLQEGSLPSLYKAFELHRPYSERQHEGADLAARYGDPSEFQDFESVEVLSTDEEMMETFLPRRDFRDFLDEATVKEVIDAGPRSSLVFEEVVGRSRRQNQIFLSLRYSIQRPSSAEANKNSRVFVRMGRMFYSDLNEAHWYVAAFSLSLEEL